MLNIISILGPSRCGKGAIIPIIRAAKNFELPFNTPDLDWYSDAYNCGDLSADTFCRLSAIYLLCYTWYGYLGRHINLRPDDYYSLQRMMPHISLSEKHSKKDKDHDFKNFLEENDLKKSWNIFQWDLPPKIYEIMEQDYPIRTNPLYCYRNPYSLFISWVSSNRPKRSKSLSRMFKYDSTKNLKSTDLLSQFLGARNDNEVSFIEELGTWKYSEFDFNNVRTNLFEQEQLIKLILDNRENANYWSKKNMAYKFEDLVSNPEKFIDYLRNRFDIEFDEKLIKEGIVLMDRRPIDQLIETDMDKIENTLNDLDCSKETLQIVVEEQKNYINEL